MWTVDSNVRHNVYWYIILCKLVRNLEFSFEWTVWIERPSPY